MVTQFVKKFFAFYGKRSFIIVFTAARQSFLSFQTNAVHTLFL